MQLPVVADSDPFKDGIERIFDLSAIHSLSVYDAAYLELAERHNLPLATLDRKLAAACKSEKRPTLVIGAE